MNDFMKEAMEIAKAQAGVRPMSPDEITQFVINLASKLKAASEGCSCSSEDESAPTVSGKNSIKETSVICLECGKKFKMLSKKHIESHGLTVEEYKEKYGIKKNVPLVAKGLVRERRKKMQEMKLWERKAQYRNNKSK